MKLNLDFILAACEGKILNKNKTDFMAVTTDTRTANLDKVFFALKGEKYDAHNYLSQAVESGASALVVQQDVDIKLLKNVSIIKVEDTLKAMQALAHKWRLAHRLKVACLTGSNGKTTTKEFATTLIKAKYNLLSTKGNFNNHIGLPLSMLQIEDMHDVGLFELGMNHLGEIEALTKLAEPDVALITTVGRAHLEGLGSIENIAKAKEELFLNSKPDTVKIYNIDNPWIKKMYDRAGSDSKKLTFSTQNKKADIFFKEVVSTIDYVEVNGHIGEEPGSARVPVFGRHNIYNLMAASSLAAACGVDADIIWKLLPECRTYWGRNQIMTLKNGAKIIFDAYNANPDSMSALFENISRISHQGDKIAIVADMLELGELSSSLHKELGQKVGSLNFDTLWYFGNFLSDFESGMREANFTNNFHSSKDFNPEIAKSIYDSLNENSLVLIKGSRGMKLERVLNFWEELDKS